MKKLAVLVSVLLVPAGLAFAQTAPAAAPAAAPVAAPAAETVTAALENAVLATGIENKNPVGEATSFTDAGRVFCWSKTGTVSAATSIKHIWYFEGEKKAEIDLSIPSSGYRTYSSKTVWPGNWKVEVTDAAGSVLKTLEFTVTKTRHIKFYKDDRTMGGHSHWAGIKHKKAALDAKKGKVFTKIIREITIAAKMGGGDLESNARLRKAVEDGKAANMPAENIKRGIMKGTGQLPGAVYEELTYEGYGPAKIAVIVETTTDNKNRTFSEVRKIFENGGGNIGSTGCVSYMFQKKGLLTVKKSAMSEDELMSVALETGAEDVLSPEGEVFEVITAYDQFDAVKKALEAKGLTFESAEQTMLPDNEVKVDNKEVAEKIVRFMDNLESHDDVKNVYANFDIPDALLAEIDG